MGNFAASAIHLPSGFLKIRTSVPKQNCTKNKHQISIECRPTETFSRRQYEKMSVKFKCQIFLPNRNDYNCIGLVDFLFRRTASSLRYYSDWGIMRPAVWRELGEGYLGRPVCLKLNASRFHSCTASWTLGALLRGMWIQTISTIISIIETAVCPRQTIVCMCVSAKSQKSSRL